METLDHQRSDPQVVILEVNLSRPSSRVKQARLKLGFRAYVSYNMNNLKKVSLRPGVYMETLHHHNSDHTMSSSSRVKLARLIL